jgi:hypothetical protein
MTIVDTGTYGAKRQSTRKGSPREILARLIERSSRPDEDDIKEKCKAKVIDDPDHVDAMFEYWFANNYRSLIFQKRQERTTPKQREEMKAASKDKVEALKTVIKARATQMVLLDMVMPSGKALRDSTGKDCAKAGGWLAKIAKAIKPSDVVGKVLSEAQIRKMFGS